MIRLIQGTLLGQHGVNTSYLLQSICTTIAISMAPVIQN